MTLMDKFERIIRMKVVREDEYEESLYRIRKYYLDEDYKNMNNELDEMEKIAEREGDEILRNIEEFRIAFLLQMAVSNIRA